MKTFNEQQMSDPWQWCRQIIETHSISPKMLSDAVTAPRSTVRALLNGTNENPRYDLLCRIIGLCIQLENGEMPFIRAHEKEVASKQPGPLDELIDASNAAAVEKEFDFL